jgi:hypothetical protein
MKVHGFIFFNLLKKMRITGTLLKIKTRVFDWICWLQTISLKSILIFFSLQIVLFSLSFIGFGLLPVHWEVKSISRELNIKKEPDQILLTPPNIDLAQKVIEAEHHEAFLNSNLQLSKTDSISLLIDLNDSLAILTFRGVYLFKSKISIINTNKGLENLPLYVLDSLFSGPFLMEEEISTIEKFPIVVKEAPKDTLEARLTNSAPELPKKSDMFWFLTFSNSLSVEIYQQEDSLVGTRSAFRRYNREKVRWLRRKGLYALMNPGQKGYTYQLSIEIPREDARSIYRALPINPVVTIRYRY